MFDGKGELRGSQETGKELLGHVEEMIMQGILGNRYQYGHNS